MTASESGTLAAMFNIGRVPGAPQRFSLADVSSVSSQHVQQRKQELLEAMQRVQEHLKRLLGDICWNSDFTRKYDLSSPRMGDPCVYALTTLATPYKYMLEAFPNITKPSPEALTKGPEEFIFHEVFQTAIERYTDSKAKPNLVLRETRSRDFCYPVTITVEAVPLDLAKKPTRLLLLREFQILIFLWEKYRKELQHRQCNADQMIGFPMPFEFCCISSTDYDIPQRSFATYNYFNPHGVLTDLVTCPISLPLTNCTAVTSTLSYMATEKLGPSVTYIMEMLRSQGRHFTLSSALMVYDQLLCRLMVMHKYDVVHGDLNTDCLRFGAANACNVLYISDFSTCVQLPSKSAPGLKFHDRFVSWNRIKNKEYNYVSDLESAFYVFLLLAFGQLPWDSKVKEDPRSSQPLLVDSHSRNCNPMVETSQTGKDKEGFWESPNSIKRLINSREFELDGALYQNFTEDLLLTLYARMKDALSNCARISRDVFLRDINVQGTAVNNAYFGLRKSIVSYFRFETLSAVLRDPAVEVKISMLKSHDPRDRRMAWDLSSWCWNCFSVDVKPSTLTGYLFKTLIMQTE